MKLTALLLVLISVILLLVNYNKQIIIEVFGNLFRYKPPYKKIPHVLTSQNISRRGKDFIFE